MTQKHPTHRRLHPGRASDYLKYIDQLNPGDCVVIWLRVSTHLQFHSQNMEGQERQLRAVLEEIGVSVVGVIRHVGSGTDPLWLTKAVVVAKEKGAFIVGESTDRFVRHPAYHSVDAPTLRARKPDLEHLTYWADGVKLFTSISPDAELDEVRSWQTTRGIEFKGGKPKRKHLKPRGKERREAYIRLAMRFRKRGASYRQIADILNSILDGFPPVTHGTIRNWLKNR
jgi:hypothetical protein